MTEQQQARTSEEEAVVKVGGEGSPLQRQGSKSSQGEKRKKEAPTGQTHDDVDDKAPVVKAAKHSNDIRPPTAPPDTPIETLMMRYREHETFCEMLKHREATIQKTLYSSPVNVLEFPTPWTIPTWEHAIEYDDIKEGYYDLEYKINDDLAKRLYELRVEITFLPLGAPPGSHAAEKFESTSEELDRVIMRCRLLDATRLDDERHGIFPPRIPEDAARLLCELYLEEERKAREVVERTEKKVKEAIKALDEIGEEAAAMEFDTTLPIVCGLGTNCENMLKRWPEWRKRLQKVASMERERFPRRFVNAEMQRTLLRLQTVQQRQEEIKKEKKEVKVEVKVKVKIGMEEEEKEDVKEEVKEEEEEEEMEMEMGEEEE